MKSLPIVKDVVQRPASPIHADGDLALFENPGERADGNPSKFWGVS
jgi:hypothetical protein